MDREELDRLIKEFKTLPDDIGVRSVWSRRLPGGIKMEIGIRMFELEIEEELAEIRRDLTNADEEAAKQILQERMLERRRRDEEGIYTCVDDPDLNQL